jgi:hypothetical protein
MARDSRIDTKEGNLPYLKKAELDTITASYKSPLTDTESAHVPRSAYAVLPGLRTI